MDAHTPGPWTLGPCSHGGLLLQRGMMQSGRFVHPQHSLQIVPEADAYLIAAAPDMLEALKLIACGADGPMTARAAIAKAEGR